MRLYVKCPCCLNGMIFRYHLSRKRRKKFLKRCRKRLKKLPTTKGA